MPTDATPPLKLYFDTHIAKAVAVQLRLKGVDVVRCEEVGMAEASDLEHLEYATAEGRVMVSLDSDFVNLHQDWLTDHRRHGGIMRINPDWQGPNYVGAIVKAVLLYYNLIAEGAGTIEDDIIGHLIFVS